MPRINCSAFLILTLLLFTDLNCNSLAIAQTTPTPTQHIAGFGDSITVGYPYIEGQGNGRRIGGYEPALEKIMENAGEPAKVYNWGLEGETTANGVNRINGVLARQPGNYMLIMEGTNDPGAGISLETTIANLGLIIDACQASGIVPIIGNLTPDTRGEWEEFKNIANTYNPAIAQLAAQKGVKLADHYGATITNWEALSDDLLHPNNDGYSVLANTWYLALNSSGSGDSGGGGGCFIATAAFESPLAQHVTTLRRFRDKILIPTNWGRHLVNFYYRHSPQAAAYLLEHPTLKKIARWALMPVVGLAALSLKLGGWATILLGGGLTVGLGGLFLTRWRWSRRR